MAYYFTQNFNEEEVLTTFELLKKQFPVLPPTISVTAVLALCRTSQWRTSLELVESMKGMNTPLPPSASIDMFYCFLPSLFGSFYVLPIYIITVHTMRILQ